MNNSLGFTVGTFDRKKDRNGTLSSVLFSSILKTTKLICDFRVTGFVAP